MELKDYLAAFRRCWRTWIGITLIGVVLGGVVLHTTPKTYSTTAQVFVAVSPSIPNGAQFVAQRVKTYPDIAESAAVLQPVIRKLGLDESVAELRSRVVASVPTDTSQVNVTVTGADPRESAEVANAVADELTSAVAQLETPPSGSRPVTLTVSDPAAVPTQPISPVALYDLVLGLMVGLFLGLAAAVVRSRMDTRVYSEQDVRNAWGTEPGLEVLAPRRGRARRSALTGRPATELARRLEFTAVERRVRVVVLSPSPAEKVGPRVLAEDVAADLRRRGLDATVTDQETAALAATEGGPGVLLTIAEPLAPLAFWRLVAEQYDGVVLAVTAGRVDAAELEEMRVVLRATDVETLAIVVTPRRRRRRKASTPPATAPAPAATKVRPAVPRPVGTPITGAGPSTGRPGLGAERAGANR